MARDARMGFGWVIWFVGLPGAGKSTYARAIYQVLQQEQDYVEYVGMDERRQTYFPQPHYSEPERAKAYQMFADEAVRIARRGLHVIMDGTAYRLSMREYVRRQVPRFAEIFVRCSLETAMQRENNRTVDGGMAKLYEKALRRKRAGTCYEGLGEVIGVDTEFEENPFAECIIDSDHESIEQGRDRVLTFLANWR
jgi:adenylylsulfate kinase